MLRKLRQDVDDFWPYYLTQHQNPTNRRLHFIGTLNLGLWTLLALARRSPGLLVWAVASSYGWAWIGHFGFERNIPATFRYPLLAGLCELRMFAKMLRREELFPPGRAPSLQPTSPP